MAKEEEKIEKNEDLEPEKAEKLDIEDIKDPDEKIEDLDLEEAVSEETEPAAEKEEPKQEKVKKEEDPEPTPPAEEVEEVIEKTSEVKKPKKPFPVKPVLIVVLLVIVVAALILGGVYYYLNNKNEATETTTETPQTTEEEATVDEPVSADVYRYVSEPVGLNLRKDPNTNGELVALMPFGAKLKVLDEQNDWLQVEYDGKTGWCAKVYTSTANPLVYQNSDYDFELTFPQSWAGYKFFKKSISGTEATYYVGLPTTDTAWTDSGADKGYASLFAVSVYTSAQWTTITAEDGPTPTKLGEKGGYVFAWSSAQSTPSDLESKFSDNKTIIATFKTL